MITIFGVELLGALLAPRWPQMQFGSPLEFQAEASWSISWRQDGPNETQMRARWSKLWPSWRQVAPQLGHDSAKMGHGNSKMGLLAPKKVREIRKKNNNSLFRGGAKFLGFWHGPCIVTSHGFQFNDMHDMFLIHMKNTNDYGLTC